MTCNNDWHVLEQIIVGTATSCNIPDPNISIMKCHFPEYEEEYIKSVVGYYPQQIIDEQEQREKEYWVNVNDDNKDDE